MAEEELIDLFEDDDERIDEKDYLVAKEELKDRCAAAKIDIQERTFEDGETYIAIGIPNGREKRWVNMFQLKHIQKLLSCPFERFVFLGDYIATCSYQDGHIEAIVKGLVPMGSASFKRRLFNRLALDFDPEDANESSLILHSEIEGSDISISIEPTINSLLTTSKYSYLRQHEWSLNIRGLSITKHDNALNWLQKLSNSLFFQIDMATGIPLSLVKERRSIRASWRKRQQSEISKLEFPKTEYDDAPVSLYWYARSAVGMPLLQFLAYYQVIEFYFFSYSQEDARRRIQSLLKSPTFRMDSDADIGKLLSAISGRGRGYGDERSQLRATLNSCIDSADLRKFLTDVVERSEFFSAKQKGLTNLKISISSKEADLRNDVAELIYDIRCKIVHTKSEGQEGDIDLLLPFSKEAELLFHDIELLQYLARQVLISASRLMHF